MAEEVVVGQRTHAHVMTHSRAELLRRCPRAEYYRYDLGLESRKRTKALSIGTAWHAAMAAMYTHSEKKRGLVEAACMDALDRWEEGERSLLLGDGGEVDLEQVGPGFTTEDLDQAHTLLHGMLGGYVRTWLELDQERWQVVGVEQKYCAPILTFQGYPSGWDYAGAVDLVIRERGTGRLVVVDHKTTTDHADAGTARHDVVGQVEGYAWLVQQWLREPVGWATYRLTRKKLPVDPQFNTCPKKPPQGNHLVCSACGGTGKGPLSAAFPDTVPEWYEQAIAESRLRGYEPTERHLEHLARLRERNWTPFFAELGKPVTTALVDDWAAEMYQLCRLKRWYAGHGEIGHPRAADDAACNRWGRPCSYRVLCELGEGAEERWKRSPELQDCFVRQTPHVELATKEEAT